MWKKQKTQRKHPNQFNKNNNKVTTSTDRRGGGTGCLASGGGGSRLQNKLASVVTRHVEVD